MEQCKDSPPYFWNKQYQQNLIPEDHTWTHATKSPLADMFQMQQVIKNA